MALISGTFIWSYEVGAKLSASIYCLIFDVDDEHMDNYPKVLIAKLPVILLVMILSLILPNNEEIQNRADLLRDEHLKKKLRESQTSGFDNKDNDVMSENLMIEDMNEGGDRSYSFSNKSKVI